MGSAPYHKGQAMVLTSDEIKDKVGIDGAVEKGWRLTTYDATVGCIIRGGVEIETASFTLTPRSIVWVVSVEAFRMPDDVTGLATLKTQWTHEGVLALNVGIIDPGWHGPLAAALVNFGNTNFTFRKGDPFFRILFHHHRPVASVVVSKTADAYKKEILLRSRTFAPTFLNMDRLTQEVSDKVFVLPRWGIALALAAVVTSIVAIFVPISFSVWTDYYIGKPRLEMLEKRIDLLEASSKSPPRPPSAHASHSAPSPEQDAHTRRLQSHRPPH